LASLIVASATGLGLFAACDSDSSDGNDNAGGDSSDAGTSAGGKTSSAGSSSTAGTASGGMQAQAGTAATGGSHEQTGGTYGNSGGTSADAGAPNNYPEGGAAGWANTGEGGAAGEAPCVPGPPTLPENVPAIIAAPAGTTLLRHWHAEGTQNYRCTATVAQPGADPTFGWTFIAPVANLFNSCGVQVGTHFAALPLALPPVPEWRNAADGSAVKGMKLQSSPVNGAIPELLLKENGHEGNGLFSAVTFVQRLQTAGGAAPAAADCDLAHVDEEQDVGYSADYYFYTGGT
jgi:hypothetical protein